MKLEPWQRIGLVLVGAGALVGVIVAMEKKANAAPPPQPPPQPKCPNGQPAPNGDVTQCPQLGQSMGQNDPTSPLGGWTYNGQVQSDVVQKAQAVVAIDPCDKANEQIVRDFQGAAGLAQINGGLGWDQVNPPGTDGRWGGDEQKAAAAVLGVDESQVPESCFAHGRPAWWGPVGTYTNP